MKYYLFAGKNELNFEDLDKFLLKTDKHNRFAVFEISSDTYEEFFSCVDFRILEEHDVQKLWIIGDDGGFYSFNGKEIVKEKDKSPVSVKSNWKRLEKTSNQVEKDAEYCRKIRLKNGCGISCTGKSLIGFDKYVFVDETNNMVIPFRFKKAKKSNQPLAVYFSGGGTLGHDNFKTLYEFLFYASGENLLKKDCNILVPQAMFSEDESEQIALEKFTDSCAEIARILMHENQADRKRVYAFGTSLGAKCVWRALLGNPDLYTAAVEAMGLIHKYDKTDLSKIVHIPIWLAHSSDDEAVIIDSDDYCYNKLKALGADVKYTRWDKYGHKMAVKFYKRENWADWLLSKSK